MLRYRFESSPYTKPSVNCIGMHALSDDAVPSNAVTVTPNDLNVCEGFAYINNMSFGISFLDFSDLIATRENKSIDVHFRFISLAYMKLSSVGQNRLADSTKWSRLSPNQKSYN